jgi:hypothetical protein
MNKYTPHLWCLLFVSAVALASCGGGHGGGGGGDSTPPVTTALPSGNPSSTLTISQSVVLTASEPATIFYTTSGTAPGTSVSGPSPLTITAAQLGGAGATTILTFHAVDLAGNVEQTNLGNYFIANTTPPVVDTTPPVTTAVPSGNPSSTLTAIQSVVLTANEPATIFYTTSGTAPGTSFSGPSPLTITAAQLGGAGTTTTLTFHGVDAVSNVEQNRTGVYTITP